MTDGCLLQELHAPQHSVQIRSFQRNLLGKRRADREENRVVLCAHIVQRFDARVRLDLHTLRGNFRDVAIQNLARQAVHWNAIAHHPAGFARGFEDGHRVPAPREKIRRRQSRGTRPDYRDALAGRRRLGEILFPQPVIIFRRIAFQRADTDSRIDLAATTRVFTRMKADIAEHCRKRSAFAHDRRCFRVFSLRDQTYIARHVGHRGARGAARDKRGIFFSLR